MINKVNRVVNRVGRIIILLLSTAISILLSRLYGVEVVGQYTYLMTTITILVLLISFGTNQSMLANFSKDTVKELISTNIKLYFLTFFSVFLVVFVLYKAEMIFKSKELSFVLLILTLSFLQAISNIFKKRFIVEDKIYIYYYFDIVQYLLLISGIVTFYLLGYSKMVYILLSVYLLFSTIVLWLSRKDISFANIITSVIKKEYFTASFLVFVSSLFLTLAYKYSIFIYEADFSKSTLGYYAVVMFLIDGITLFLASVMFADINRFKNASSSFLLKYTGKFLLVALIVTLVVDVVGYKLLEMVYQVNAKEVEDMLNIMKYSISIVLVLKIVQNYFIMNKLYAYYLYNSIVFITFLFVSNYFYKGYFESVLYNYIISLFVTTVFSIVLYAKSRQVVNHVI